MISTKFLVVLIILTFSIVELHSTCLVKPIQIDEGFSCDNSSKITFCAGGHCNISKKCDRTYVDDVCDSNDRCYPLSCVNGLCKDVAFASISEECVTVADCVSDLAICSNNVCVNNQDTCSSEIDCDPWYFCNSTNQCEPKRKYNQECTFHYQCDADFACTDGVCSTPFQKKLGESCMPNNEIFYYISDCDIGEGLICGSDSKCKIAQSTECSSCTTDNCESCVCNSKTNTGYCEKSKFFTSTTKSDIINLYTCLNSSGCAIFNELIENPMACINQYCRTEICDVRIAGILLNENVNVQSFRNYAYVCSSMENIPEQTCAAKPTDSKENPSSSSTLKPILTILIIFSLYTLLFKKIEIK